MNPQQAAEEALRAGDPRAALAKLTEAVRAKPADPKLRTFLAQLLAVLGQWERAHTQLNVVAEMDKLAIPMRETMGHAIRCELLRAEVFAGRRTPVVFGQPEAWVAQLIESLRQQGEGHGELAADLAAKAFEAAPTRAGTIDGQPFEWLADADSRLGPVLEACLNGHYTWVPFQHLAKIHFDAPEDLRDCVWMPAQLSFTNGGHSVALVPTRYPGSEKSEDGLINLARKTEWTAIPGAAGDERYAGLGQRVLASDAGDHDLMAIRDIMFEVAEGAAPEAPEAP
ncbi:tetratricopeptide repeat protein [Pelomonas sp. P7]|uniref:Tetratricopeptide repeat protein n=1 Tax=Pelomonas caseinilytica TaxID=2906763 RepID=A0ABS8XEB1_9BURK|nr:type VI secretion system accessory protein TagJ [Pelomonas sp. P7]MCE4538103.1 tetratricopeptide repeat protein [Pelomonas sp. P7]